MPLPLTKPEPRQGEFQYVPPPPSAFALPPNQRYRLRPLPSEAVFIYRKRIDNSSVAPRTRPAPIRRHLPLAMLGLACFMLIGSVVVPAVSSSLLGYQIERLTQELEELTARKSDLEAERAALIAPARLLEVASKLALEPPQPSQVFFLNPPSDHHAVALNTRNR